MPTINPKTRGNYRVEFCLRALPSEDRGACMNYGEKCGECFKFEHWKEGKRHVDSSDYPNAT